MEVNAFKNWNTDKYYVNRAGFLVPYSTTTETPGKPWTRRQAYFPSRREYSPEGLEYTYVELPTPVSNLYRGPLGDEVMNIRGLPAHLRKDREGVSRRFLASGCTYSDNNPYNLIPVGELDAITNRRLRLQNIQRRRNERENNITIPLPSPSTSQNGFSGVSRISSSSSGAGNQGNLSSSLERSHKTSNSGANNGEQPYKIRVTVHEEDENGHKLAISSTSSKTEVDITGYKYTGSCHRGGSNGQDVWTRPLSELGRDIITLVLKHPDMEEPHDVKIIFCLIAHLHSGAVARICGTDPSFTIVPTEQEGINDVAITISSPSLNDLIGDDIEMIGPLTRINISGN